MLIINQVKQTKMVQIQIGNFFLSYTEFVIYVKKDVIQSDYFHQLQVIISQRYQKNVKISQCCKFRWYLFNFFIQLIYLHIQFIFHSLIIKINRKYFDLITQFKNSSIIIQRMLTQQTTLKQSFIQQTPSHSYPSLQQLLTFHGQFLNLVHSQIYSHTDVQTRKQALLKFQIIHMGDKNQLFNTMISILKKDLIDQKQQYDSVLKSYFIKVFDLNYLPFLHINRYQLAKLSIFGFDIYIDPLEAILEILNRIERIFYSIQDDKSNLKCNKQNLDIVKQQNNTFDLICQQFYNKNHAWQVLLSGWNEYYLYLNFQKLSLNIYLLKQYIQTAGSSLFKKDKQIIFTGILNINKKLLPFLIRLNIYPLINQLAQLNNVLYSFHNSFDYFNFYSYIPPQKEYCGVYDKIIEIEKRCKNTNILTPLLFGILNNYQAFVKFIQTVQYPQYCHILRVLLSGLVMNFKLRILQYKELLHLIRLTIQKLYLLTPFERKKPSKQNKKPISISKIITNPIPNNQWRQAKDFFISAFKSGYNIGQIQTWTLCQGDQIQILIRKYLIEGILLLNQFSQYYFKIKSSQIKQTTLLQFQNDQFIKSIDIEELQIMLGEQISLLTNKTQTLNTISNSWKNLLPNKMIRQKQLAQDGIQNVDKKESQCQNKREYLQLVRIVNLMNVLQKYNQKNVYAILTFMINCYYKPQQYKKQILHQTSQKLNLIIANLNRKQSLSHIKDILLKFHTLYPPGKSFQDIVPIYLHCFIIKQAILSIFEIILVNKDILKKQDKTNLKDQYHTKMKYFIVCLIQKYCPKQKSLKNSQSSSVILKGFQKQYQIQSIIFSEISTNTQIVNIFSILIKLITSNKSQHNMLASQCLLNFLNFCPWYAITVLNLPAAIEQKIQNFSSWLIGSSQVDQNRKLLLQILQLLTIYAQKVANIQNKNGLKSYLKQSYYFSILDNVLGQLNVLIMSQKWQQNAQINNKILNLINLFQVLSQRFDIFNHEIRNQNDQNVKKEQKIWYSLLDIIYCILKNMKQFSYQRILKSCTLYWKIINNLKKSDINEWYKKSLLSGIFSNGFNGLNENFKGISYINQSRNYMSSIQIKADRLNVSQKNQQKVEHYNFDQVKEFYGVNYKTFQSNKINKNQLLKAAEYLQTFNNIINQSQQQVSPSLNKTSPHILTNQKQILPSLQQTILINLYQLYCKLYKDSLISKQVQKQCHHKLKQIQFCLYVIKLDYQNNKNLWKYIKQNSSQSYLFIQNMNVNRQNIGQVVQIQQLLTARVKYEDKILQNQQGKDGQTSNKTTKLSFFQQFQKTVQNDGKCQQKLSQVHKNVRDVQQNQDNIRINKYLDRILAIKLFKNNISQLQLYVSAYHYQQKNIELFLKRKQQLWFLIIYNNSNWRQFNQSFIQFMKKKTFISTLLQYKQFIAIAKKANNDYERQTKDFAELIQCYSFFMNRKILLINSIKYSNIKNGLENFIIESESYQNQIRKNSLLINAKVMIIKCQWENILQKIVNLAIQMHKYSISKQSLIKLLQNIHQFNSLTNILIQGNIKLPSFIHHNRYVTQNYSLKQFSLGRWLQNTIKQFENTLSQSQSLEFKLYKPQACWFVKNTTLQEFLILPNEPVDIKRKVLLNDIPKQSIISAQQRLDHKLRTSNLINHNKQKNCLQISNQILINNQSQQIPLQIQNDLYTYGYLLKVNESCHSNDKIKFSSILQNLIDRRQINIQMLKNIQHGQTYHHLSKISLDNKLENKPSTIQSVQKLKQQSQCNLSFVYQGKELIPNGKNIQVNLSNNNNSNNSLEYFNLVAESVLGQRYIKANHLLALGYINAEIIMQYE